MSYENMYGQGIRREKITKNFSNLSTAGLTNTISLFTLPVGGIIHSVQIVARTKFAGGTIATYTLSVGITGTLAKYAIATNVFTGATLPAINVIAGIESDTATTDIKLTAISTVGLLNAATAGSADIYIYYSVLD